MIHSRKKDPGEILEFCDEYNKFEERKPLVVVPSALIQYMSMNSQKEV